MWYPNRLQWAVIWIASGLAYALFLDSAPYHELVFMEGRLALGLLWFGALLVWQLSRPPSLDWLSRGLKRSVIGLRKFGRSTSGQPDTASGRRERTSV